MSREIKFRQYIWDTDDKSTGRMVDWEDLLSESGESLSCTFSTKFSNASELMQFAGLHDKNGKEIYEGDIWKEVDSIGVIEYQEDGFKLNWTKNVNSWDEILRNHAHYGKVISNIYDNPSLLEVQP